MELNVGSDLDSQINKVCRKTKWKPPIERFWANVDKLGPDDCWLWAGSRKAFGYGQIVVNGKTKLAHRYSWELAHGPPPDASLKVCHSCDNPPCVNPKHLYTGTQAENIRDAERKGRLFQPNAHKTHCPSGHSYDLENTQIRIYNGSSWRVCKECTRIKSRNQRARKTSSSALKAVGA